MPENIKYLITLTFRNYKLRLGKNNPLEQARATYNSENHKS